MWQGAWRSLPCEGSKLRNFCAVKSKLRLSPENALDYPCIEKEAS